MTKTVRIENACTNATKKIVVEVWDKSTDGPKSLVSVYKLDYPTELRTETLWEGKELRIREE